MNKAKCKHAMQYQAMPEQQQHIIIIIIFNKNTIICINMKYQQQEQNQKIGKFMQQQKFWSSKKTKNIKCWV